MSYRCDTCNRKVNRIRPTKVNGLWIELCLGCVKEHELQTDYEEALKSG